MKEREALKITLEALERGETELRWKAITAAKEALAQPEPSPEWMTEEEQTAYTFGWFKALEQKRLEQPKEPEQEPVAFIVKQYVGDGRPSIKGNGFDGLEIGYIREEADEFIAWVNNHITTPPQRTWVGLTLDERLELAQDVDWAAGAYCEYAEKVEAKLKEKNHD